MSNKNNKLVIILLLVVIIILAYFLIKPKNAVAPIEEQKQSEAPSVAVKDTYTYTNHGFSIELPKAYIPKESESDTAPIKIIGITLPKGNLSYITDASWWDKESSEYNYINDEKIGVTTFKVYSMRSAGYSTPQILYVFRQGKVLYEYYGDQSQLETFKFVGWPQIEGNKKDLVSFSIEPGQEVSGKVHATGVLSGGYFFEANVPIAVLDANKNLVSQGFGTGTADWMTRGPVPFYIDFDFSKMPKGKAYIKITQDDPSGGANGFVPASIFISIIVK